MALDKGHEYADTELRKLEKKLEKEYTQALKDMEKKTDAYFSRFKEQDAKQLALLQAGKITQDEYNKWRLNHMLTGERYNHFVESLAQDLTHTNEIAMSMLNPTLASAWAENYNYGGYEIAKGLNQNIAWELADHDTVERLIKENPKLLPKPRVDIPKDKRWNQQKLKSALTQGIIQGESIKNISKRLQSVTDMSTSAAIRNARTATTGAENAGRMQSYEDAEELGIQMQKQWISTLDDRTRETHVLLDQEIVDTDEAFSNKLMYPGDPDGAPEEVYNCRCTMIGVLKNHHYKMDNRANKLGDMTYEEWKHQFDKPVPEWVQKIQEIQSMSYISEQDILNAGEIVRQEIEPMRDAYVEKAEANKKAMDEAYAEYSENSQRLSRINSASEMIEDRVEWDDNLSWESTYADLPQSMRDRVSRILSDNNVVVDIKDSDNLIDVTNKIYRSTDDLVDKSNKAADRYQELRKEGAELWKGYANDLKDKLSEVRPMGAEGIDFSTHLLGKSPMKSVVEEAYNYYPTEWVQKSMARGILTPKKVSRGYYSDYDQVIAISGDGGARSLETAIHELGHRFERSQELRVQEKRFYERRTQGESLQWLGNGYEKTEMSRFDNFVNKYMGKDYGGTAYELCSMGFEYAYTHPELLAKDKDMEQWILGMLAVK